MAVFFLENFMMDSLILLAVNRILKCSRTYGRIFAGAVLGSVLTCIVVAAPLPGMVRMFLFHGLISSVMILTGLKVRGGVQFAKAFLLLYLAAFYFLFTRLWKTIPPLFRRKEQIYEISVFVSGNRYGLKAPCDTGNVLKDPLTGDPVCILDSGIAEYIFDLSGIPERFRYIPYRCVGGESVIKIFRVEQMCILAGEETWIRAPLLGVGEAALSESGAYQMLLNPDVFQ